MSAQVERSPPGQLLRGRLRRLLTNTSPRSIAQALVRREVPLIAETTSDAEATRLSMFSHSQDTRIQNSTVNTTVNYYYTLRSPLEANEQDELPSEDVTMADVSPSSDTVRASDDNSQSPTPGQKSMSRDPREVYIDIMITKNRGFPLWIPSPNTFLPPEYRYSGVSIGDVGVLTPEGAFDFIFNVFADASDPIHANSDLMENFSPLTPLRHNEIQRFKENTAGTSLGDDSFERTDDAEDTSKVVLTTLEPEAAVLLMPEDVYMVRMKNIEQLRAYVSAHLTEWYSFIRGTLGRDVGNGALRVVYGYRKSTAFGIASKSTAKKPTETRLTFCKNDDWQHQSGYKYRWIQVGSADTKTGPEYEESAELMYPLFGTSRRLPENLCLFISMVDAKLSDETWKSIESSPVHVVDTRSHSESSSFLQPENRPHPELGYSTAAATAEHFSAGSSTINSSTRVLLNDISLKPEPVIHPSNLLNDILLATNPGACISIVCNDDWEDHMDCQDPLEFVSAVLCKSKASIENNVVYLDSSSPAASEPESSGDINNKSVNSPHSHNPSSHSNHRHYTGGHPEISSDEGNQKESLSEAALEERIARIRLQNEKIKQRRLDVQADEAAWNKAQEAELARKAEARKIQWLSLDNVLRENAEREMERAGNRKRDSEKLNDYVSMPIVSTAWNMDKVVEKSKPAQQGEAGTNNSDRAYGADGDGATGGNEWARSPATSFSDDWTNFSAPNAKSAEEE